MHYKNGRRAAEGDKVLDTVNGVVGILVDTTSNDSACNGYLIPDEARDVTTVGNCLHLDDIAAADIPNPEAPAGDQTDEADGVAIGTVTAETPVGTIFKMETGYNYKIISNVGGVLTFHHGQGDTAGSLTNTIDQWNTTFRPEIVSVEPPAE